jgi:hypothetical protein
MGKLEVIVTIAGLTVAGFAAVLGIWVERDPKKPPRYAWALSVLILLATFVGMIQTYLDEKDKEKMEADMARMLQTLDTIAQNSDVEIPELNAFLKSEIEAQQRANPDVVDKFAQRVADEGGDPSTVLGSYLPPSELEAMNRKGQTVKPKTLTETVGDAKPRRTLKFGGDVEIREDKKESSPLAKKLLGNKDEEKKPEAKKQEADDGPEPTTEEKTDKVKGLLRGGGGDEKAGDAPKGMPKLGPKPKPGGAPEGKPKFGGLR